MIRPVFLCVSFPLIACSAVLAQDETSLNRGAYGSVMTPEQVMRELGPGTGLLPGDQAYEGRPVKSVSVRYRSTGKTVSEDRLKNLLATQPGTSYSPEVVNKDLERLPIFSMLQRTAEVMDAIMFGMFLWIMQMR